MRAEGVIGYDRRGDEIGSLRLDARVEVLSVVAVWKPVEGAIADRCHEVGNEIASELVSLIHRHPERARLRLPRHTNGIAEAGGENAMSPCVPIDLPDRVAFA